MFSTVVSSIGPLLTFGVPLFQSEGQHHQSIDQNNVHHLDNVELAEKHHHIQMEHDREIARRESLRDIWAQKANKSQTLMINTTLMFGGGFAILVEGMPPEGTSIYLLILFSITLGLSFLFLFLSLWFSMTLQSLMVKYNIHNPNQFYSCQNGIQQHNNFDEYYQCHCVGISRMAVRGFYFGTVLLLITAVLLFHMRFTSILDAHIASYVFMTIIFITLLILAILKKYIKTDTRVSDYQRDIYLNG